MKISIIVPVYNLEDYITDCLNSISNLNIKYEIIIINDGSTDNSLERIREFSQTFQGEILIINKENGGLSSARNAGIMKATGDYISFIDGDDFINKEEYELFINNVIKDGVDLGFGDYRYLRKGKIEINREASYRIRIAEEKNDIVDGLKFGERFFDYTHNFFNTEACFQLIKKSFLIDNKIEFKSGIYHEDTLFTLTCLAHADKVKFYDYPFYIYRMRDGSIMNTPKPKIIKKKYLDKKEIALDLFKIKEEKHISSTFLDTLIVDLLLVSAMHFKMRDSQIKRILAACNKLTNKAKIRVLLYKLFSLSYS